MRQPSPEQLTHLTLTILHRWRAGLEAEWQRRSSITNPRHDLSRDIAHLDAILSDRWQLTITPVSRKEQQ